MSWTCKGNLVGEPSEGPLHQHGGKPTKLPFTFFSSNGKYFPWHWKWRKGANLQRQQQGEVPGVDEDLLSMSHFQSSARGIETRFVQPWVPGGGNERPDPVPASEALGLYGLGGGPVLVPDASTAAGVLLFTLSSWPRSQFIKLFIKAFLKLNKCPAQSATKKKVSTGFSFNCLMHKYTTNFVLHAKTDYKVERRMFELYILCFYQSIILLFLW